MTILNTTCYSLSIFVLASLTSYKTFNKMAVIGPPDEVAVVGFPDPGWTNNKVGAIETQGTSSGGVLTVRVTYGYYDGMSYNDLDDAFVYPTDGSWLVDVNESPYEMEVDGGFYYIRAIGYDGNGRQVTTPDYVPSD